MSRVVVVVCALVALAPGLALACPQDEAKAFEQLVCIEKPVSTVSIAELSRLREQSRVEVVDSNNGKVRQQFGVIPGAILLTSSSQFDPARELPSDKGTKLVFYCANTQCRASHLAAQRASAAGYADVSVLPDGIMGWKAAGQPTAKLEPRS